MPPVQSSVLKAKWKYGPAAKAPGRGGWGWSWGRGGVGVGVGVGVGSELELGSELESALAWEQELGQGPQSEH